MAKQVHKLSSVDVEAREAVCSNCGPVRIGRSGRTKYGKQRFRCLTGKRNREGPQYQQFIEKKDAYRASKKDTCERCRFEAEDSCQLDVHHRDHNKRNNDPSNLQTLCANCHRLHHRLHYLATKEAPLHGDSRAS